MYSERKIVLRKMLFRTRVFFTFCLKKVDFFAKGGRPPPLLWKKLSFDDLPKQ